MKRSQSDYSPANGDHSHRTWAQIQKGPPQRKPQPARIPASCTRSKPTSLPGLSERELEEAKRIAAKYLSTHQKP